MTNRRTKALLHGPPMILGLVLSLFFLSFLLTYAARLPPQIVVPVAARVLGLAMGASGLLFAGWAVRVRGAAEMIESTYVSLVKALSRSPPAARAGRTEPLVVVGPQRYTRNPLYFGVVLVALGWGLFSGAAYLFVAFVVVTSWFVLVQIPYEERELHALFVDQWKTYSELTPMLVPWLKIRRRPKGRVGPSASV